MGSKHKKNNSDESLPLAKTKLADAVSNISHRRLHAVSNDDKATKHVWLSSRYDELAESVEAARGGSGGKWSHQLPFWADGFMLLGEIDTAVMKMHAALPGWIGWTKARLDALANHSWRPQDCSVIFGHVKLLDEFCARIDALFTQKPISLPNPCPECHTKWVYRAVDDEQVRSAALQITADGCTCGNCRANWPVERLPMLGKILGYAENYTKVAS